MVSNAFRLNGRLGAADVEGRMIPYDIMSQMPFGSMGDWEWAGNPSPGSLTTASQMPFGSMGDWEPTEPTSFVAGVLCLKCLSAQWAIGSEAAVRGDAYMKAHLSQMPFGSMGDWEWERVEYTMTVVVGSQMPFGSMGDWECLSV